MLKKKTTSLQKYIFSVYEGLVDTLKDRFLMLITDLVPFLLEGVSSRQEGIAPLVRRIISKVEELSGE